MSHSHTITNHKFRNLANNSDGFAAFSFESISSLVHHHEDFYELILIISGKWQHSIENITTTLLPGTLLLFPPGITHLLFPDSPQSIHFVFCVEQHYFERYAGHVFPNFSLNSFTNYISRPVPMEKMKYMEYLGKNLCKNHKLARTLGNELLFLSLSTFLYSNVTHDCSDYVTDIVQKLNNHIYLDLSVKEICAKYPSSQTVLLSQFKKITGMTIVQYRAKQKLQYACQLLTETGYSLLEISSFLHYDSLSYFMHAFKDTYGITPTEYRKLHRKGEQEPPHT